MQRIAGADPALAATTEATSVQPLDRYTVCMRIGPLGTSEIGIVLLASFPWIVGLGLAVVGLVLLHRLVRASERIADAQEAQRRDG